MSHNEFKDQEAPNYPEDQGAFATSADLLLDPLHSFSQRLTGPHQCLLQLGATLASSPYSSKRAPYGQKEHDVLTYCFETLILLFIFQRTFYKSGLDITS